MMRYSHSYCHAHHQTGAFARCLLALASPEVRDNRAPSRCPVCPALFSLEMVRTRNTRGRTGAQRTRRKTPQTKKPTGWIRGTSGIRTPDGKILTKSDIKSVLLSSKEAVAKRRDITAAEYGRVWQAISNDHCTRCYRGLILVLFSAKVSSTSTSTAKTFQPDRMPCSRVEGQVQGCTALSQAAPTQHMHIYT